MDILLKTDDKKLDISRSKKIESAKSRPSDMYIFLDIPQVSLGNIQSRDAFRPIVLDRKYFMDYN